MKKLTSLVAIFMLSYIAHASTDRELATSVSMVALLANPEKLDGKPVIVAGYVCKDPPRSIGLFLTRSDCIDINYSNAIRLDLSRVKYKIGDGPVLLTVEGRFESWAHLIHTDEPFFIGQIKVTAMSGRTL